jgi:hypothetical protein
MKSRPKTISNFDSKGPERRGDTTADIRKGQRDKTLVEKRSRVPNPGDNPDNYKQAGEETFFNDDDIAVITHIQEQDQEIETEIGEIETPAL